MGQNFGPAESSSDLPELFEAWGVDYQVSQAVVDRQNSIAQGRFTQPSWLVIRDQFANRSLLPSSELEGLVLLEAGSFKTKPGAPASIEPVLVSSSEVGTVQKAMLRLVQPEQLWQRSQALAEPAILAGLLESAAVSAFPDGPPAAEDEDGEPPASVPEDHLSTGNVSAFLIADSDFLLDRFSIQRMNFFGMEQVQKQNDNQALAANFIEFLSGSPELIAIRSKGTIQRQFDVLVEMEQKAQQAFQSKLQEVEERLEQINSQISQLATEQGSSGTIYITPEMEEVIEDFRAEEAAAMAERREIRRNLRQGIETLGAVLGAVNLAWAPIALLIFAVAFNRIRKG